MEKMERKGKEPERKRESMSEEELILKERKRKGKELVVEEASIKEDSYMGEMGRIMKERGIVQWGRTKKRSPGYSRDSFLAEIIVSFSEGAVGRSPPPPPAPPGQPPQLVRLLAGGQIARLSGPFEKKLTTSDVDNGLARLLIPKKDVATYIKPVFGEAVGDKFVFHDGEGIEYEFAYRKWGIGTVFNGQWKKFMQANRLHKDDSVQIWVFEYSTPGRFGGIILPIKQD